MTERFYPNEQNLNKNCRSWDLNGRFAGCNYPKAEMEGRTSCEGLVDDMCLWLKDGRRSPNIQVEGLKLQPPKLGQKPHIPPGN